MFILAVIGWMVIAAGGFAAFVGFSTSEPFWIAKGLSGMISGVPFLALDRGLSLLSDIRNELVGETLMSYPPEIGHWRKLRFVVC